MGGEGNRELRRQDEEPSGGRGWLWGTGRPGWLGTGQSPQSPGSQDRKARGDPARQVEGPGVPTPLSPPGPGPQCEDVSPSFTLSEPLACKTEPGSPAPGR